MEIFFSVGEPSGDLHGGNLIRELKRQRPGLKFVGYGGPRMAEAGCTLQCDLTQYAIVGILQIFKHLATFWRLYVAADVYFRTHRPAAVVLIDYPGFNWWIARRAKAHGIPVFYYGTPQIWAWASWRVRKMRRLVDHILCKLPFEPEWYAERGCTATYVGHPYFDQMEQQSLDLDFIADQQQQLGPLVTILPGSRTQEVTGTLRWLLTAAERVQKQVPNVRFAIASYKESQAAFARQLAYSAGIPVEVHVGRTQELIAAAHCCMACSGSVSLELLYHGKPTVIVYSLSQLVLFAQKFLRKVKYITLVNLLATKPLYPADLTPYRDDQPDAAAIPMPEYFSSSDPSEAMARHVAQWLTDDAEHTRRVAMLASIRAEVGQGGASRRAAEYIAQHLPQSDLEIERSKKSRIAA